MSNLALHIHIFLSPVTLLGFLCWLAQTDKRHPLQKFWPALSLFIYGASLVLFLQSIWMIFSGPIKTANFAEQILGHMIWAPLLEESLKALGLIGLWKKRKTLSIADGILYGVAIGLGFAATENLIYTLNSLENGDTLATWYQVWFRSLRTPLLHAGATGIFGLCVGWSSENVSLPKRYIWPIGLTLATTIHAVWNLLGFIANTRSILGGNIYGWLTNLQIIVIFIFILLAFAKSLANQRKTSLMIKSLIGFVVLFGFTFWFRHLLLQNALRSSEYQTAIVYMDHSKSRKNTIDVTGQNLSLKDVFITSQNGFVLKTLQFKVTGVPEVRFAEIKLISVADFLLVYTAELTTETSEKIILTSSYQKILEYLSILNPEKILINQKVFRELSEELADTNLKNYLKAKQKHIENNFTEAVLSLDTLERDRPNLKELIDYEQALILYDEGHLYEAAEILKSLVKIQYSIEKPDVTNFDWHSQPETPDDAFALMFFEPYIIAKSLALLAKINYENQNYDSGEHWAKEAVLWAGNINNAVLLNNALYLKALNLQAKGDLKLASLVFDEVLNDPQNPNLSQKAWGYFFKSETAIRENRHEEALNYLEMAISLDPGNTTIRQKAILYLIERNYPGDIEVALGMALRGISHSDHNEIFTTLASQIYQRLAIVDKTAQTR